MAGTPEATPAAPVDIITPPTTIDVMSTVLVTHQIHAQEQPAEVAVVVPRSEV